MSPGGSTPNSRRSRPELPPSSVTVTTAVTVSVAQSDFALVRARRGLRGRLEVQFRRRSRRCGERLRPSAARARTGSAGNSGSGVRVGDVERWNRIHDCAASATNMPARNCRDLRALWSWRSARRADKSPCRTSKSLPIVRIDLDRALDILSRHSVCYFRTLLRRVTLTICPKGRYKSDFCRMAT